MDAVNGYGEVAMNPAARCLRKPDRGFTLIELLVVIVIISVLAGLISAVLRNAIQAAKRAKAGHDVRGIHDGIKVYFLEYGKLPSCKDGHMVIDFEELHQILMGGDGVIAGWSNDANDCLSHGSGNPKHIVFFSPGPKELCKGRLGFGEVMKDPWGTPYNILLDTNYDDQVDSNDIGSTGSGQMTFNTLADSVGCDTANGCPNPGYGTMKAGTVVRGLSAVWSNGPDKKNGYGDPLWNANGANYDVNPPTNGSGSPADNCGKDDIISWVP